MIKFPSPRVAIGEMVEQRFFGQYTALLGTIVKYKIFEPRCREILNSVGELMTLDHVQRVIFLRTELAFWTRHRPQEVFLALVIAGRVVGGR